MPEEIIGKMKENFNSDAATGMNTVFEFQVEDADTYHFHIHEGNCNIVKGGHDDPDVTLIMDTETLTGIVNGDIDGMQAFMGGQLRAEGDIMLATRLGDLFNMS